MRCVRAPKNDGVLVFQDEPAPSPGKDEVLMKVTAAGVNRLDILQKYGRYPVPQGESDILGVESAGVVESIGENVTNVKVGDRVCALAGGGGYAQKVIVPAMQLIPSPSNLTDEEACAIRMFSWGPAGVTCEARQSQYPAFVFLTCN
jgi:NADPH:quinone reductase-like Zn-dependent oxidoreductase